MKPPEHDWTYVAFDPGVTTGVACWNETCNDRMGTPVFVANLDRNELSEFLFVRLPGKHTQVIIYEEYKILPHKARAHIGSTVPTIEVIGAIKEAAKLCKVTKIIAQSPSILSGAQAWSGLRLSSNHADTHWESAYNHGYHWLLKQGLIKARVLRKDTKD